MTQGLRVARRYARALFETVSEGDSPKVRHALQALASAYKESPNLRQLMTDPMSLPDERTRALLGVFETTDLLELSPFRSLLELLVQRKRTDILPALAGEFSRLCNERSNARSYVVSAPKELNAAEKQSIVDRLSQGSSGTVYVDWFVDDMMIAGLQIRSGDKLIDRSLGSALERLAAHLISDN